MSDQQDEPRFVTCHCQHCEKGIEFDASSFEKGEAQNVECPHCKMETVLFIPSGQSKQAADQQPPPSSVPVTPSTPIIEKTFKGPRIHSCPNCAKTISKKARFCVHCGEPFPDKTAGVVIGIFAAAICVTGGYFVIDSIINQPENIMQQSYLQARMCFGLVLMALAALIGGVVILIRK